MKRLGRMSAVAILTGALSVGTALAQAPLGFTIDPTTGIRGTTVNGQVNPADVAANCATTAPELQAAFQELFAGPFVSGDTFGDLPQRFFPDGANIVYETPVQMAYVLTLLPVLGISADINGAAAGALPQTFVMTFADFTQKPLGERGSFDPVTGVGSVVVPDITPGVWPVAATCVTPTLDLDAIEAGIRQNGQFLADAGIQFGPDGPSSPEFEAWAQGYLGSTNTGFDLLIEFGTAVGPDLLVPIMIPAALGVQLFTITTPTLGFTIDPTEGLPGDTVDGQVNVDDINAHCVTDLAEFQASFEALFTGPYASGGPEGALFDHFFPGGEFVFDTNAQSAYSLTGFVVLGIGANINGAAETALPQTFVMTFADLVTQDPLGPLGHFDPATGVGSVVVPNIDPGLYPVAATCVRPTLDVNLLIEGIEANGAYLQSIGAPADINSPEFQEFVEEFVGPGGDLFTFLNAIGPQLIQNIVTPGALGIQFYNVLADLDHFQCYRARTSGFDDRSVTLSDQFGSRTATVRKAIDLCAPADKNEEDPTAPESPDYLTTYRISAGSFQQINGIPVTNQFGETILNIRSPKILMVPTAASQDAPPSSPDGAFLNHFTCYDVRVTNGTVPPAPGPVSVVTPFETVTVTPRKPMRLCVKTSKNGEPLVDSRPENLLCYKAKSGGGLKPAPTVFLANQFGPQTQRLGQRREICIPTDIGPM